MATDLQGLGLGLASRFATNPIVQKYKLAKPAEKFAYISTKKGFEFAQRCERRLVRTLEIGGLFERGAF